MKTPLAKLRRHLETLEVFAARYDLSELNPHVSAIHADGLSKPSIFIASRHLARAVALFGVEDWKRRPATPGWLTYFKTVDGIEVNIDSAERVVPAQHEDVPPGRLFGLLGHDAGISLAPGTVRDVEAAV